jgi:hypothetical protein
MITPGSDALSTPGSNVLGIIGPALLSVLILANAFRLPPGKQSRLGSFRIAGGATPPWGNGHR